MADRQIRLRSLAGLRPSAKASAHRLAALRTACIRHRPARRSSLPFRATPAHACGVADSFACRDARFAPALRLI